MSGVRFGLGGWARLGGGGAREEKPSALAGTGRGRGRAGHSGKLDR